MNFFQAYVDCNRLQIPGSPQLHSRKVLVQKERKKERREKVTGEHGCEENTGTGSELGTGLRRENGKDSTERRAA